MKIQDINDQFAISQHIYFEAGSGELPMAQIKNMHASAMVSLYGAQVVAYQPQGEAPVLWHSRCSNWTMGKAIRGGIPLCWPWFGPDPTSSGKPQHGFVRTMLWNVLATKALPDGSTQLRLGLRDNDESRTLWPYPFMLECVVTVGLHLSVELMVLNTGTETWQYTGALHSYFGIDEITDITVRGLEGLRFIDKVDQGAIKVEDGAVTVSMETDRIYIDSTSVCTIEDPGLGRRILVQKVGSQSTVVWNPWAEKSQQMSDMCDEEYHSMVCVETTNAGSDVVVVGAGESRKLGATIQVERWTP